MYNEVKTTRELLKNVTYGLIINDDRPFDSFVPYYLSRDCFHAYVSLQLALRIYLSPMYLHFYTSCYLRYCF